jgi:hypothetical protein
MAGHVVAARQVSRRYRSADYRLYGGHETHRVNQALGGVALIDQIRKSASPGLTVIDGRWSITTPLAPIRTRPSTRQGRVRSSGPESVEERGGTASSTADEVRRVEAQGWRPTSRALSRGGDPWAGEEDPNRRCRERGRGSRSVGKRAGGEGGI